MPVSVPPGSPEVGQHGFLYSENWPKISLPFSSNLPIKLCCHGATVGFCRGTLNPRICTTPGHCLGVGKFPPPSVFNRVTQAACRVMGRRGHTVCRYHEEFLVVAPAIKENARRAFNALLHPLRALGFYIGYHKVVSPTMQHLPHLPWHWH